MADITIIRNGARISLANFPKLGSGSENISVAVSASGAYDTYTTELYYGWYQGSSMQKMLAQYQNGLYYIPSNALFNAGNVYLTLRLVSGGNKVSTNTIPITIERSAVNNEYSILPATETWQSAVDYYINNSNSYLNKRIDNLVANTGNSNSEIVDARLGADGVLYSNLGTAIRTQVNNLNKDVNNLNENLANADYAVLSTTDTYIIVPEDMEQGSINRENGAVEEKADSIRSKNFIDLSRVKSFSLIGITAADYFTRVVYYDDDKNFLESTDGFKPNKESVNFTKPHKAMFMRVIFAYMSLEKLGYVKPTITYAKYIDGDLINRSVNKGKLKTFVNDWEILESKRVTATSFGGIWVTDDRGSCTANFLRARKGDKLAIQSPISFSVLLFRKPEGTSCFYNSADDDLFYSNYTFNSDCYFMLNFTNRNDLSAQTKETDIVWVYNTAKGTLGGTHTEFIVPDTEYSTIHVASAWASDEEKMAADYVCDGKNDGEELQQAIYDLMARDGGVLKLSNERYIIDTLFDSGYATIGKYGIFIPQNNNHPCIIKIEGVNFPNVIQPMYFGHCARLDMSQELYDSLSDSEIVSMIGVRPVFDKNGKPTRVTVGCTISVKNIAINIPAPNKKIIGINCEYAYNMNLNGVHCGLTRYAGDPHEENGKIINSNIDCIGIRTLYGYNWGSGYHIDDCNVRGWGLGFDISGEHLIMQNACARFVNTGYRFGHFGDDNMMSHPNTLINCCEEWLLHGMVFEGNKLGQSLNIVDFNIEDMTGSGWGRKTYATESNPGSYRGTLTYTTTHDSYYNAPHKFWENGSGINILTRDLNDKFSGTTSERPKYPQNNQQYFDKTLNKMLYYINNNWVDAMGEVIN